MRILRVLGVIGKLVCWFSFALAAPLLLSLWDSRASGAGNYAEAIPFAAAFAITWLGGWFMTRGFKKGLQFQRSEALGVVAGSWLIIAHFAAIPYLWEGMSFADAIFESMSGFTSTGATILLDFDAHNRAFFLWRSITQWIGGLGIIALFVVILPQLGIAGRQLFFAESSTAPNEIISARVKESARKLWILYLSLTIAVVVMLMSVSGWSIYDSVCHALTTVCAGGFSPDPLSIGGYQSPSAEWILTFFMLLAGVSFPLIWISIYRRPLEWLRDGEFRFYFLAWGSTALMLAFILSGDYLSLENFRHGLFQCASLISSTGYASTDYNLWGSAPKALLLLIMLVGGCAGSAAGGAKAIRHLLALKFLGREIKRVLHPRAILPVKHKGKEIPDPILRAMISLILLYLLGYLLIGCILTIMGIPTETAFSAALGCLGNIGPGFGEVGPMGSYGNFPDAAKLLLTFAMWIGRMELVAVLALFHIDVIRRVRWTDERKGSSNGSAA